MSLIVQQMIDEQAAAECAEAFAGDVEAELFDPACACRMVSETQPNGFRALVLDESTCPVHGQVQQVAA
jgi:hypothetical protein